MNVGFFRLYDGVSNEERPSSWVGQVLKDLDGLQPSRRDKLNDPHHIYWVRDVSETDSGRLQGLFVRCRLRDVGHKGNTATGDLEQLGFEPHEGPSDAAPFMWDPVLHVLAYEESWRLAPVSKLGEFLRLLGGKLEGATVKPILRKASWEALLASEYITKLEFSVASPDPDNLMPAGPHREVEPFLNALKFLSGNKLRATISVGRRKGKFLTGAPAVIGWLGGMLNDADKGGLVKKAKARHATSVDEKNRGVRFEDVDLIATRMRHQQVLSYEGTEREHPPEKRLAVVREAFAEHHEELEELYPGR